MTKRDFLNTLVAGLSRGMTTQEMAELRDYYAEQIDDRVEDGLSEDAAVAALGDPSELAEQLLKENGAPVRPTPRVQPSQAVISGEIRQVVLHALRPDVTVSVAPLPEGESARFEYAGQYEWSLTDGTLTIEDREREQGLLRNLRTTPPMKLTLAAPDLERLEAQSRAGDLTVTDVRIAHALEAKTSSGDLLIQDVAAGELAAECKSGDIHVRNAAAEEASIISASGDLTLEDAAFAELLARTTSGDVKVRGCRLRAAGLHTSHGDVRCQDLEAGSLRVETINGNVEVKNSVLADAFEAQTTHGDVRLDRLSAATLELRTTFGDIKGKLLEAEGGYRFEAHTALGDLSVPPTEGARLVKAQSRAGDIRLGVEV